MYCCGFNEYISGKYVYCILDCAPPPLWPLIWIRWYGWFRPGPVSSFDHRSMTEEVESRAATSLESTPAPGTLPTKWKRWGAEEEAELRELVEEHRPKSSEDWRNLAELHGNGRSESAVKNKWKDLTAAAPPPSPQQVVAPPPVAEPPEEVDAALAPSIAPRVADRAPNPTPEELAQPPARRRRRREHSEVSAFLSNTYAMISALDGVVGGWSKNGDTMVIFDPEKFAAEIIPQYFRHNNFRSFVRQLHHYGFQKLRADANAGPAAQAQCEFKHPNFRRGRHDLLVLIDRDTRPGHGGPDAAAQRARQAELGREVADLHSKVANLTETLDKVVGVLASQGLGLDGEHLLSLTHAPEDSGVEEEASVDSDDDEIWVLRRPPAEIKADAMRLHAAAAAEAAVERARGGGADDAAEDFGKYPTAHDKTV